MSSRHLSGCTVALATLLITTCLALPAWGQRATPLTVAVEQRTEAILDALKEAHDFEQATRDTIALLDQLVIHAPAHETQSFRQAAFTHRLVRQLKEVRVDRQLELLAFLRESPDLAQAMVFLIDPLHDDPREVYGVLWQLMEANRDKLNRYASLAAAICVVHDKPYQRSINENRVEAPPAVDIFTYFVDHERQMVHGLRDMPAELLVHVVDLTGDINEYRWALDRYAGDARIGQRFFDVRYDYDHFRRGTVKKVTELGFNLPNILEHGGVCADQAYFATAVGKAMGVPTVYTSGRGGDVSHAWVGFLEARGRTAQWNFDHGRYQAYQGVRGVIHNPQTRERVSDSYVAFTAELARASADDRYAAAAMLDAAQHLAALGDRAVEPTLAPLLPPEDRPQVRGGKPTSLPRERTIASQLELVEQGLRRAAGYADGWRHVAMLAQRGALSLEEKRRWADVLDRLTSGRYPDFTVDILVPMIQSVGDIAEQDPLWEMLLERLRQRRPVRYDLLAEVRMLQGDMYRAADDPTKAGLCYLDLIERYANHGPFVLDALARTEQMLIAADRSERTLALYQQCWEKLELPGDSYSEFRRQSNWYRVGRLFEQKLEEAGEQEKARVVAAEIERVMTGSTASRPRR